MNLVLVVLIDPVHEEFVGTLDLDTVLEPLVVGRIVEHRLPTWANPSCYGGRGNRPLGGWPPERQAHILPEVDGEVSAPPAICAQGLSTIVDKPITNSGATCWKQEPRPL